MKRSLLVLGIASQSLLALASPETRFAIELYKQLSTNNGNLFFSPYSLSTALAMTQAGAGGETKQEMTQTLRLNPSLTQTSKRLNELGKKGDVELSIANALWVEQTYPIKDDFLNLVTTSYEAKLAYADFVHDHEQARLDINHWVEYQTKDKIKNLISSGLLDPDTALVLVNAIYLKGSWAHAFEKKATQNLPFYSTPDQTVNVPTMIQTETFNYAQTESAQIIELPYKGGDLSMLIVLPNDSDELKTIEDQLSPDLLQTWISLLSKQELALFLPTFNVESKFELNEALQKLGMKKAFSDTEADFSGMSDKKDLYISKVIHQAFVAVDEQGTEAAAATAVVMETATARMIQLVKIDHPFLFFIREKTTGLILFMGRVTNPN